MPVAPTSPALRRQTFLAGWSSRSEASSSSSSNRDSYEIPGSPGSPASTKGSAITTWHLNDDVGARGQAAQSPVASDMLANPAKVQLLKAQESATHLTRGSMEQTVEGLAPSPLPLATPKVDYGEGEATYCFAWGSTAGYKDQQSWGGDVTSGGERAPTRP
uniref:Uncharacterized protein n=1 Tax=Haptolina brevifila TaxID=156173 RepID=A0A7S2NMK0_9EUKA|mmetsp:Transcript_82592/g.164767  ORF Transcript_82592/g.164767 Transcript_82592/m.164767 type:complete len:161 (+) Transcript_82592:81-563(+)